MNAYSKLLGQAVLGLGLTVGAISGAYSATIGFSGDTTGAPTYHRLVNLTTLSSVGTAVPYQVLGFTVDTAGTYSIETTSGPGTTEDSHITLYSGSFDANSPLTNAIAIDDDSGTDSLSLISTGLSIATQYFLVVTAFDNSYFGAFTGTISSDVGTATLDQPTNNVPLPSSFALLGLGALAFLRRRAA